MEQTPFIMPGFPDINLSLVLNIPVLLGFLVLFAVLYSVVTSIIVYHWSAYGMNTKGVVFAESAFFLGTIILFVCAGVSLFYL